MGTESLERNVYGALGVAFLFVALWVVATNSPDTPTLGIIADNDPSDITTTGYDHYLQQARDAGYSRAELHWGRGNCSATDGPHIAVPKLFSVKKTCFFCGESL